MDKVTRQCTQTTTFLLRAKVVSDQGPPAYQPNALPLGQTGSHTIRHDNHLPCRLCQRRSQPSWPIGDWKPPWPRWCSPPLCSSDRQAGELQARTESGWFPWHWRWWVGQLALEVALHSGNHDRMVINVIQKAWMLTVWTVCLSCHGPF